MNILEAISSEGVFGKLPVFAKHGDVDTWANWKVALKGIFGLGMTAPELEIFQHFTGRTAAPTEPVSSAFLLIGRRGGKSFISALILVYLATLKKWPKSLGRSHIICIACDRAQAQNVLGYARDVLSLPAFAGLVESEGTEEIRLKNKITIGVHTSSFRALRGYRVLAAVADEVSFWRDDSSANPAQEILNSIRPALGEVEGSLLLCISSAYSNSGIMAETFRAKYGIEDPSTLVWKAGTSDMNPLYSKQVIERARLEDPQAAASEYDSEFRQDLETYISSEALDAVVIPGRLELPPQRNLPAFAAIDPSGGRGDAMTLSIFYKEPSGKAVQAVLRVRKPPFDPSEVVKEFAGVLKEYGLSTAVGDSYSASWCSDSLLKEGIIYTNSKISRSQIYSEFLPLIMRRAVELLDHKPMIVELRGLERRTGRGRDMIDHPQGGHDDCANVAALGAVLASKEFVRDNTALELGLSPSRSMTELESIEANFLLRLSGALPGSAGREAFESEEENRRELQEAEEENRRELLFDKQASRTFHGWKP